MIYDPAVLKVGIFEMPDCADEDLLLAWENLK